MRNQRSKWVALVAAGAALTFTGCGSDGDGGTGPAGGITVTVGAGTNPTYTWPGVGVFSVSVVRTSAPATIVWGVATPGQDNVASPVTHGTVPSGAVETASTETTLTAGVEYRVTVSRIAGAEMGQTVFTP